MNIALINGSPKVNNSSSEILSADLKKYITDFNTGKNKIKEIGLHDTAIPQKTLELLKTAEVWVFIYPLYVDGIPAHLLSCLIQLEETDWQNRQIPIFGIVNCGFYEGVQAEFALDILQNWCMKSGFIWGGGIGVGGGGALARIPTIENGHGPKAPIEKALRSIAKKILQRETQQNDFISVAFPRLLYKMAAQMGWRHMIKANGGKIKDLGNQPR